MMKNTIRSTAGLLCVLLMIPTLNSVADDTRKVPGKREANTIELNPAPAVKPAPATGEEINWQVISGGGASGTSANYGLGGTVGQIAASSGTSSNLILHHGFWQDFGAEGSMCGDANGDGNINIGDVVHVINYIFKEGPASDPLCISDANGDGPVNIGDVVHLVNYIFREGPIPDPNCCP